MKKSGYSLDWNGFNLLFPTEEACESALQHARWPHGFVCPRCEATSAYKLKTRKVFQCSQCTYQASLTSGTVFAHSRTNLRKWFFALYLISKYNGINAVQLQQALQVTYKTAWLMMSKIRYAINDSMESTLLSGFVQVDSAVYGKQFHTKAHYQPGEHPVVIGGTMKDDKPAEVLIKRVLSTDPFREGQPNVKGTIHQFIETYVDSNAEDIQPIHTRYFNYRYRTLRVTVKKASCWLKNTYRSIGPKHLQAYLSEFSFRYNAWYVDSHISETTRGFMNSTNQYNMFQRYPDGICQTMLVRLIDLCSTLKGKTYRDITLGKQANMIRFRRFSDHPIPSHVRWAV